MCYRDATGWKLRPDTLALGRPTSIPVVGATRLRSGLAGRRHSEVSHVSDVVGGYYGLDVLANTIGYRCSINRLV
jgi:hypothetical protein